MTRHDLQVAHDEPPVAPDTADVNALAIDAIALGRAAILDCRTAPVSEWAMRLPEPELRRVAQALAFMGGLLAIQGGDLVWSATAAKFGTEVTSDGCR